MDNAMAIPVPQIAKCGVWYFVCTFSKALGNKLSRAMANGNREVAMIPANAIAVTTVTANTAEMTPMVLPPMAWANTYTGSSRASPLLMYASGETVATITMVMNTYKIQEMIKDSRIPYGIFLLGFLISPPTAAILVTPA